MILFDKTGLAAKFDRKLTDDIGTVLTPEADNDKVREAYENILARKFRKLSGGKGYIPAEICVASAVALLRLGDENDNVTGAVAADDLNEAMRTDPSLNSDRIFGEPFIFELIKARAEQGDCAAEGLLADIYVGDTVTQKADGRAQKDGVSEEKLAEILDKLAERESSDEIYADALHTAGISPAQLKEELAWKPYEKNLYALARKYMRDAEAETDDASKNRLLYKAACLGNIDAIRAYVARNSGLFEETDPGEGKAQYKAAVKACKKALAVPDRALSEAEKYLKPLSDARNPGAMFTYSRFLAKAGRAEESNALLKAAAEKGEPAAIRTLAAELADPEGGNFEALMRMLFMGIANPGSFAQYGSAGLEDFSEPAKADNQLAYEKLLELLEKYCVSRDFVDELSELTDKDAPEARENGGEGLDEFDRQTVFMWYLCDRNSDRSREILARLYHTGFGTEADDKKAIAYWRELCEKYDTETSGTGEAAGTDPGFMPWESFYEYARELIVGKNLVRDREAGRELLKKIPESAGIHQKAARLLALLDTRTSELLRLGRMFHKEENDAAMLKLYSAAELLGDSAAPRGLGRYYEAEGTESGEGKALEHYELGALRGDVLSMYLAGAVHFRRGNYGEAAKYMEQCADAGKASDVAEQRSAAGRAAKELAEMKYSGTLTGEKDVPGYLYWLERAEEAGYKLSDLNVDKRRAADNYFKLGQWSDAYDAAMQQPESGYRSWIIRTCADRKIAKAQEELGVRHYTGGCPEAPGFKPDRAKAYGILDSLTLPSPRAQYYIACCLYRGEGTEKDAEAALKMLPAEDRFGDPEQLRDEIAGMAAYCAAEKVTVQRGSRVPELYRQAAEKLEQAYAKNGASPVLYELADIYLRAFDDPELTDGSVRADLARKGLNYLRAGFEAGDGRVKARIESFEEAQLSAFADMFTAANDPESALFWRGLAAGSRDGEQPASGAQEGQRTDV